MSDAAREWCRTDDVLCEVANERRRQDVKWGPPKNLPDGTSWDVWATQRDVAQADCDAATKEKTVTYRHILQEEVLEAFAEEDQARLRAELIQVAAVVVKWIEAIDLRASRDPQGGKP